MGSETRFRIIGFCPSLFPVTEGTEEALWLEALFLSLYPPFSRLTERGRDMGCTHWQVSTPELAAFDEHSLAREYLA